MVNFSVMHRFCFLAVLAATVVGLCGCKATSDTGAKDPGGAKVKAAPEVTVLKTEDIKKGDGGEFEHKQPLSIGDTAYVLYTGSLADGTVFDSNETEGKDPFSFTVGSGQVIKGWDQGVVGMVIGGERKLSIPSSLGYGAKGSGKIPGNASLFFDVKLLDYVERGHEGDIVKDDVKIGTGPEVEKGKKVTVKYNVTDLKGTQLDSNEDKGLTWTYGTGQVYESIEVGLQGMKQGGVRVLRLGPLVALPSSARSMKAMMQRQSGIQHVKIELVKVQ
jgi:FKBP-type peptidyl-prolyl cis-trans isomerase